MPKPESLQPLRHEFDAFTQRCEASKLPDPMQPSALLLGYDPLLSQGTFRMTGDPNVIAQVMIHALRDPANLRFREVLEQVLDTMLTD